MTDNFKEIGSLFGREGSGAGFVKQTDKESFTYAFAWPEGDTWATLTGYLNLDEQPEEYVRRVLQDGGFRSDWGYPDYDPIGDFKETAGDEYRIPLLKVLLREQLESRYEVANHFSTMNRARVELSAFIQNEGGAPLPEDALGTPEEQGIRAMLIATGEPPREVTLLPDKQRQGRAGRSRMERLPGVEGYFTVISRPGSGAKAVDDIRHGITPGSYDISVESHDCTSGRNALAADAPAMDAPGKDNQNIG